MTESPEEPRPVASCRGHPSWPSPLSSTPRFLSFLLPARTPGPLEGVGKQGTPLGLGWRSRGSGGLEVGSELGCEGWSFAGGIGSMTKAQKPLRPLLPHPCHVVCLQLPEQFPLAGQGLPWALAALSPWQPAAATAPPNREHTTGLPGAMTSSAAPLRADGRWLPC